MGVSVTPTPGFSAIVSLKGSLSFVITILATSPSPSGVSVEVQVQDPTTGVTAWIKAVGGSTI